jgi:4-amino-4-deoxy-L-arabinose transferase-like glycosyltransferase
MRIPLFGLMILYLLVGVTYAYVTPALEKHDENGHYGYILYLREHRALPPLKSPNLLGFSFEYKQPPLYYALAAALTGWLPEIENPDILLEANPYRAFSVPGHRHDNRNVFLHPPHMTPVVLGARLVSLLFGLGTMIVAYFLARQLFPESSLAPAVTAIVTGFHPQFLYVATAVSNDAMVAFLGGLIVLSLVRQLQQGPSRHQALLLGVFLGLASITKVSALTFFPLTGLALLLIHRGLRRSFFRDGIIIVIVALLVGGWWYARNTLLYHDPLSIGAHVSSKPYDRLFKSRIAYDLFTIEHTFWANPSRTFVSRIWLDNLLIWWGRISMVLLLGGLWIKFRTSAIKKILVVLLSWPVIFIVLIFTYWTRQYPWAFGRLLFPTITPIAMLLVLGWLYALPRRWRHLLLPICVMPVLVAGILTPFVSIYPLYHPRHEKNVEQIERPVNMTYVEPDTGIQVAQLISYDINAPFSSPGTYLSIELCWKPLAQTNKRYAVFVQVLDTSKLNRQDLPGMWGSRQTYPGLGNLPTDRWILGKAFCDDVLVYVSEETPTPLGATIEVGFIDPETGKRMQAVNAQGEHVSLALIGSAPILAADQLPQLPTSTQKVTYVLDRAIGVEQTQVSREGGDSVVLTITWQSLQPVPYDATTFVHLKDAKGDILAQADRQPLDGRFPTSYWLPGQIITDVFKLPLIHESHKGPLVLSVGMYKWPSLERLPMVDVNGNAQPNHAFDIPLDSAKP